MAKLKNKESIEEPVIELATNQKPPKFKRNKNLCQNKRKHVPYPAGRYQIVGCRDVLTTSSHIPVRLPSPRRVAIKASESKPENDLPSDATDQTNADNVQDKEEQPIVNDSSILARLYYPAFDQSKSIKDQYLFWPNWLPHENYRQGYADFGEITNKSMINMINWFTGDSFIPCVPNVKPLRTMENDVPVKLPVVIFSHGIGSCRTTASAICCELASNGYFVIAIEHRDGTACASFIAKNIDVPLHSEHNPDIALPTIEGLGPPSMSASLRRKQKLLQQVREQQEINRTMVKEVASGNPSRPKSPGQKSPGQTRPKSGQKFDDEDAADVSPFKRNGFSRSSTKFSPVTTSYEWIKYQLIPETDEDYYEKRLSQVKLRAYDISNALDVAIKLNNGIDVQNILDGLLDPREFKNLLDIDNAIVMGFSMGSASALYAAAIDTRFKLIVALDTWMYPVHKENLYINQPIIFINSEKFQSMNGNNLKRINELIKNCDAQFESMKENRGDANADANQLHAEIKGDKKVMMIKGSVHYNQTDLPFIFPLMVKLIFGGSSKRNRFTAHDLTTSLALVFMAQQLSLPPSFCPPERERYVKKKVKRLKYGFPKKL